MILSLAQAVPAGRAAVPAPRIGAPGGPQGNTGNRRAGKPEAVAEIVGARIIYLSWAQTFGRPPRARLPGMIARILPFRQR